MAKKYKIDEILVAIPSADKKELADILNICKETKCHIKRLPGMYQFINDGFQISDFKDVEVQDLLGRDTIEVSLEDIMGYVTNKVVMVTGGGGSIGSELCRQIAANHPKQLVIVDIMGATKRLCEMIVQTYNKRSQTEYVAVRFGNVLGSNGSVIPLFKKQIKAGGPVTVTHPDIIRYFMTIPEAVSLVLQAGAYAKGGEIFILDMGKPVKIVDMARNLIKLSGYDVDIEIEFTGLRPGEKLYEELLMKEEGLQETSNRMIHIGKPIELDERILFDKLKNLKKEVYEEIEDIRPMVQELVPTYKYKKEKIG